MAVRSPIFIRCESSPGDRFHPQHLKIARRDQFTGDPRRFITRESERDWFKRGHLVKYSILVAPIEIVRIREAAALSRFLTEGLEEPDKLVGVLIGDSPQQNGIYKAEYGGRGADRQHDRQHG